MAKKIIDTLLANDIIYTYDLDWVWGLQKGWHTVTFDDGDIELRDSQIKGSWYYWAFYRLLFETHGVKAKSLKQLCINGLYTDKTHLDICSKLLWYIFDNSPGTADDVWILSKEFCKINNLLFNMNIQRLGDYITTASMKDSLEVLNDPELVRLKIEAKIALDEGGWTEKIFEKYKTLIYDRLKEMLYVSDNYLANNGIKKKCLTGVLNQGQVFHVFGVIGYFYDIDGVAFKYPILDSYAEGVSNGYGTAIEARSASKAYANNTIPLEQSEYFKRRATMACSIIHSIEGDTCTGYVVTPELVGEDDGIWLNGKYYMEDDKAILIQNEDVSHLVGKVINLRLITGCGNHDPQTVCKTCFGWRHHTMPPLTNIGWAIVSEILEKISSALLSTKHHVNSHTWIPLELNKEGRSWLRLDPNKGNYVYLAENVSNVSIKFNVDDAKLLNQINHTSIENIWVDRVTSIKAIEIGKLDANGNVKGVTSILTTKIMKQGIFLSREVLEFIKVNHYTAINDIIEIKLTNWDNTKPVFQTPKVGDDPMLLLESVVKFLEPSRSPTDGYHGIRQFNTVGGAINELAGILTTKFTVNILQVEIFIKALMCVDSANKDYRVPIQREGFNFDSMVDILLRRNLSTMLMFEHQRRALFEPHWFDKDKPRQTHPYDIMVNL